MEIDYEKDVQIDPTALDVEWLNQADLMLKYSKYCADKKKEMDEEKEKLDFIRATLDLKIRSSSELFGLAKPTESSIQSTILLQKEYQEQSKKYALAKYEYDVASGAVRAIDQKKTALENLVKLLSVSYFAGPKAPRDLYQEQLEYSKRRQDNSKVKINPKMRRTDKNE